MLSRRPIVSHSRERIIGDSSHSLIQLLEPSLEIYLDPSLDVTIEHALYQPTPHTYSIKTAGIITIPGRADPFGNFDAVEIQDGANVGNSHVSDDGSAGFMVGGGPKRSEFWLKTRQYNRH